MKKTAFFGLLAIMLAFGMIGCDINGDNGDNDPFKGTWEMTSGGVTNKIVAAEGRWKQLTNNKEVLRGSYSFSGNTVTTTLVEINLIMFGGEDTWSLYTDLDSKYKENIPSEAVIQQFNVSGNSITANGITYIRVSN